MEIKKLKKRLMKEEIRRRYPNRARNRWIGAIVVVLLLAGGIGLYHHKRDDLLQARYEEALELMRAGSYEEAIGVFTRIHEGRPDSKLAPQALFHRGEILNITLKQYEEALIAYLQLLKEYPNADLALRSQQRVAEIYKHRLQDNSSAIVAYQNLLDMGTSRQARARYEIADSYFKLNNFEQARIEFEGFLEEHPDSEKVPEVTYRLGVCLSIEGELQESEEVLRRVVETWPEAPYTVEARFALAEVLEEQERLTESLTVFEKLKGEYPNPQALEKKLSQVRERIRKKKKAI